LKIIRKYSVLRFAIWAIGGLAIFSGALAVWLSTTLPRLAGEMTVGGLTAPVEVLRDENGVPHIFAGNEADAAFALGFVHAQDRMWQMEGTRRLGAGRLSEVVGDAALEADRLMRMLNIYRLAEAQYETLSAPVQKTLDAYNSVMEPVNNVILPTLIKNGWKSKSLVSPTFFWEENGKMYADGGYRRDHFETLIASIRKSNPERRINPTNKDRNPLCFIIILILKPILICP